MTASGRRAALALRRLERLRAQFGPGAAQRKLTLLSQLDRLSLASAGAVARFHELLLFLRTYPDDRNLLSGVELRLARFARRADLRRFRVELCDSGIAGCDIVYPFFHVTARRLARRFPDRLSIDWSSFEAEEVAPLARRLATPAEQFWLTARSPTSESVLAAFSGGGRSDAVVLHDRLEALPLDERTREALHDEAAPIYRLRAGLATPNRTTARAPATSGSPVVFRSQPPDRRRPDLAAELARPPRAIDALSGRTAEALVELARDAMVPRARDLDCFCFGDARDVRRILHDDGLEFVAIGSQVDRRLLLSTAYGLLSVRNGVPIGYVQLDGFLGTALVHFNTFETFRGADAAWVFARALATAHALFGSSAFAIEPYQLGHGNDEALDSGAWWFYRKLGFAPRHPAARALAASERRRLIADPGALSPRATLAQLARTHLYWEPAGRRATVPPEAAIARLTTALLADHPEPFVRARRQLTARARAIIGFEGERLSARERLWLERWAPLLSALPGVEQWPRRERTALGALVRAKAGRRESELVPICRDHPRFGPALLELARRHGGARDLAPAEGG